MIATAPPLSGQLPRPGDMIAGKYQLEHLIGQGGMGAVFAARHLKLSKAVAIKIMLADASNPEAATRFINEGRAAANIQNEHVVRVDDVDEELGYAYMVLELLDGEDLAQVLERDPAHRLPPHVAVNYVLQALKGVAQAHAIGIVHRDLKPSNLFLARRKDGSVVVKVLDFGISKAQGSSALAASPSALTSTKAMLGSPLYMSPEQLRSSKNVDHRADIWAIGIILYELITGSLPFMGDNLGELFAAILETDPLPLRQRIEGVHPGLDETVLRCLARKPEHRFQSANELAQALAPFAQPIAGYPMMPPSNLGAPPSGNLGHVLQQSGSVSRPGLPAQGAVTGSGPRVIGGTVPLGAMTPPQGGLLQTGNNGWQSTGTTASAPKSKAPFFLAFGLGLAAMIGIVLIAVYFKGRSTGPTPDPTSPTASVAGTASTPVASVTPTAAPTASALPDPAPTTGVGAGTPSTSSAPSTPTVATTTQPTAAAHPTTKPTVHHTTPTVTPKVEPPPPATKPPPPDPPPKKPPSTPTSNNGNLQNAR